MAATAARDQELATLLRLHEPTFGDWYGFARDCSTLIRMRAARLPARTLPTTPADYSVLADGERCPRHLLEFLRRSGGIWTLSLMSGSLWPAMIFAPDRVTAEEARLASRGAIEVTAVREASRLWLSVLFGGELAYDGSYHASLDRLSTDARDYIRSASLPYADEAPMLLLGLVDSSSGIIRALRQVVSCRAMSSWIGAARAQLDEVYDRRVEWAWASQFSSKWSPLTLSQHPHAVTHRFPRVGADERAPKVAVVVETPHVEECADGRTLTCGP